MSVKFDLVAYTDGGCDKGGKPDAGAGVWLIPLQGEEFGLSARSPDPATNNTAELHAFILLLKHCIDNNVRSLQVWLDSQYVLKGASQHVHVWKKNDWITSTGAPVKNKEYWLEILECFSKLKSMRIEYQWVKGHSNVFGNEQADRLATWGKTLDHDQLMRFDGNEFVDAIAAAIEIKLGEKKAKKAKKLQPMRFLTGARMMAITHREADMLEDWYIYNSSSYPKDPKAPMRYKGSRSADYHDCVAFTKKTCPVIEHLRAKQTEHSPFGSNMMPYDILLDKVCSANNWKDLSAEDGNDPVNPDFRGGLNLWADIPLTEIDTAPRLSWFAVDNLANKTSICWDWMQDPDRHSKCQDITDLLLDVGSKDKQTVKASLSGVTAIMVPIEHEGKVYKTNVGLNKGLPTRNGIASILKEAKNMRVYLVKHDINAYVFHYSFIFESDELVVITNAPYGSVVHI